MRNTKLSHVRRSLLARASDQPVCVATGLPTTIARETTIKAAKALVELGMGRIFHARGVDGVGILRPGMVYFQATALGKRVFDFYRREFETGARIRWARFDGAARAPFRLMPKFDGMAMAA